MKLMLLEDIVVPDLAVDMMRREQTLNQLLVEMDGFEQNSGVIIIAATNQTRCS